MSAAFKVSLAVLVVAVAVVCHVYAEPSVQAAGAAGAAAAAADATVSELTRQFGSAAAADARESRMMNAFSSFVKEHGRRYATADLVKRYQLYKAHDAWIEKFNSEGHSFTVGHNFLSDFTAEEKRALHTGLRHNNLTSSFNPHRTQSQRLHVSAIPAAVDWRANGAVNTAVNQGGCGSCWIFGSAAAMEGGYFVDRNQLVKFSEQYMLDCTTVGGACSGGFPTDLAGWLLNNGAPQSKDYTAYHAAKSACGSAAGPITRLDGYYSVPAGSEANGLLKTYVAERVVAQELCVDDAWGSYKSGIYSNIQNLNRATCGYHEIAVVGYGHDTVTGWDYWIVRNSWGTGYGQNGYILMRMNNNECEFNEFNSVAFYYGAGHCSNYQTVSGYDFPGNDLRTVATNSLDYCNSQCLNDKLCGGIVFHDNMCWLKTAEAFTGGAKQTKAGSTAGRCGGFAMGHCSNFKYISNSDFPNVGDLYNVAAANMDECFKTCDLEPACGGAVLNNGKCYLKSAAALVPANMKAASGVLAGKCGGDIGFCTKVLVQPNVDYPGSDLSSFSTSSIDDCYRACNSLSGCGGLSFHDNTCWLKSAAAFTAANQRAFSGATIQICQTNVALNKAATLIDVYPGTSAAAAVDNILTQTWSASVAQSATSSGTAWWRVDLGAPFLINTIVIYGRTDCCQDRTRDTQVWLSNSAAALGSPATQVSTLTSAMQVNEIYTVAVAAAAVGEARYVELRRVNNYIQLFEVQVFSNQA